MNATQTMEKAGPTPLGLVMMNATQTMEKPVPALLGLLLMTPQMKLTEIKSIAQELHW